MPTDRSSLTWTTADVLSDVRRAASLPATSTDWTDVVLLREVTNVLWDFAGWALIQGGEGRLLSYLDRATTSALPGAAGQREFLLPSGASLSTIEDVSFVDQAGMNESRLLRIDHADGGFVGTYAETGTPNAYTLIGERIRLYPAPSTGGTLRITYPRRHAELVADTALNVATLSSVTSASSTTSQLTIGVAITALAVGDALDVIRSTYPYAPIVESCEVTALAGANLLITVDRPLSAFTGNVTTGARVVRAGRSPYVAMPLELRSCITEKTTANVLRAVGDLQGSMASEQAATVSLARAMQALSPRAKRDKPKAINPNSLMRGRMTRGRW